MAALLPSVPEICHLLTRLVFRPPIAAAFVLAWSTWRRRHQFTAAQAHYRHHQMQL
jgi:hypothetical protein